MKRTPVKSSNIKSIGYDGKTSTLEIEFSQGAVYQYLGVPEEEHIALMQASSKGKYFIANIKSAYDFTRVS